MPRKRIRFYVDTKLDADIVAWLGQQANQAAAIREAIRAQMARAAGEGGGVGLDADTFRRIVREELARVAVQVDAPQGDAGGEDDETTEMLDDLLSAWDFGGEEER